MSSGRCRLIHVGLLEWFLPFVLVPSLLRLTSRPAHLAAFLVSFARPVCSCRGAGSLGVGSIVACRICPMPEEEGVALRGSLLRSNETAGTMVSVWIVWISFSRLLGSGSMGYILYRALSMVRRLFSLVFSADGFASS